MNNLKKVGFAASLLLASSFVNAGVYTYNLGDITNSTVDTDTLAYAPGEFTDNFNFTLSEENYFDALATSSIASVSEFTLIKVGDVSGTTYDISGVFSIAEYSEGSVGLNNTLLSAGNYTLSVSGIAGANSTGYTLNTVTSPIPEPSAIALMLGGLGLVGFMAARSRKQNA